ncbi:MAG: hypothetical protein O2840_03960, partial [bacterium]|nr:hypothetical protein [bacterium]
MKTLQRILSRPKYFFVSIVSAIVVVVIATWLPNFGLIASVLGNSTLGLFQKVSLLLSLVGSFQTNFTLISQVITIITAVLVGVQMSLFIYLLRQRMEVQKSVGMSFAGILSSMLGIGCAS